MIGLSRLKRAIADVPTGGMQTGYSKVPLKLCDAQRLEVEFNAITAERDAALAQNAELVAQNEAVRQACLDWENTETPNAWQLIFDEIKRCANAAPQQCLRDVKAEAIENAANLLRFAPVEGGQRWALRHADLLEHAARVKVGE